MVVNALYNCFIETNSVGSKVVLFLLYNSVGSKGCKKVMLSFGALAKKRLILKAHE